MAAPAPAAPLRSRLVPSPSATRWGSHARPTSPTVLPPHGRRRRPLLGAFVGGLVFVGPLSPDGVDAVVCAFVAAVAGYALGRRASPAPDPVQCPAALFAFDPTARQVVWASPRLAAVLGRPDGELSGADAPRLTGLVHPDDLDRACRSAADLTDGVSHDDEVRVRHADGSWRWIRARRAPSTGTGPAGRTAPLVGVHDLTGAVEDTVELAHTLDRLWSVFDAATHVSIIATDRQGTITLFNPGACRLLGHTPGEAVGRNKLHLLHLPAELGRG